MADKKAKKVNKNAKYVSKDIIVIAIVLIAIVAYIVAECYSATHVDVQTITAVQSTVYQTLDKKALIIRDEHIVEGDSSGVTVACLDDGEKVKVARGVNSLHILSGDKTEDMKKIKIIEGMDLMRDDIRSAFENNYIGINNSYDNKVMFVAAINQYFDGLVREGVLYGDAENTADIDVNAQRDWLAQKYDISEYSDEQIRKAKTGSYVFVTADITFCDAIEDLKFSINME